MIKLAVILCGGIGTRLGNLTKNTPKGMIKVSKKPFLEHLIIQLKKNGINEFIFLVGFKAEKIQNYFESGKKFGVKISYSYSSIETETLKRIYNAKSLIKKDFILLYSDNYYPLNLDKLFRFYRSANKLICLNLCKKNLGNFSFENKKISYSKKRNKKFNYVEIGYSLFNKRILNLIKNINKPLNFFLENMILKEKVSYFKNYHEYLSIGDRERLLLTRQYFNNNKIILIDRDGTLNKKIKNKRYITHEKEVALNSKFIKVLKKYNKIQYICITNQAGVATGDLNKNKLLKINQKLKKLLKNKIYIKKFFSNTDHYKSNSFYRKPNPGMFLDAAKKYKFLLDQTIYIGDDLRDIIASYNASTDCYFLGKKNLNLIENKNLIKISLEKYIKNKNDKK